MAHPRAIASLVLGLVMLLAMPGFAQAPSASATASTGMEIPLPELPKLGELKRQPAPPERIKDLDARLTQLGSLEVDDPLAEVDLRSVTADLSEDMVGAIAARMAELKSRIDGDAAERVLERARKAGRKAIKRWKKENKAKKDEAPDGDWLVFMISLDKRGDTWRDAVELYAMLRMLEQIGNTPAVRVMIDSYSSFGELVRIDLQRAFERMKDKAVPALLEATKHDARKVRQWARRQLDGLGKVTPGEVVSTTDPVVLADALRAFGRIRDVEATRVVLSFAGSDRVELRTAARAAIGAIGEPAEWHIKDSYKSQTGKRPPKSWDWKRTAREIFRLHDRARLAKVYEQWERGQTALKEGKHADAVEAFDQVLARVPLFEQRAEMAPAYLGKAEVLIEEGKRDQAMVLLRKALRLAPETDEAPVIESKLLTLEAETLIEAGTPDRFLLDKALELDPNNERAKALLRTEKDKSEERQSHTKRYLAAVGVGLLGLIASILLIRRPRKKKERESESAATSEPSDSPEPPGPDAQDPR